MTFTPRSLGAAGIVLAGLAAWALAPGTGPWVRNVFAGAALQYRHRNSSPQVRAGSVIGEAHALVTLAAGRLPPDVRVLIPSGPEYEPLSNRVWAYYYLRPRAVVTGDDLAAGASADVVLVYRGWGLEYAGFPADTTGVPDGVYRIER